MAGILAVPNADVRIGGTARIGLSGLIRSLQKVQGHRTAQGHRAGVDVEVTPPTGGPNSPGNSPGAAAPGNVFVASSM